MIRLLAFVLVLYTFVSGAVMAQDVPAAGGPPLLMLKQYPPTHPERIVMAFHKIAGLTPDFNVWAKKSPFLRTANPADRDSIVNRETNRLQQAWNDFNLDDLLIVHTMIHLDNYSTIQETLILSEFTPKTFFSFSMYDENVAIVPQGMANYGKIPFTKTQMDEMLKKAAGGQITAELLLKPAVADPKTPFVQNGTSYWLLLAEIAEIRFWSNRVDGPQLLWMHRADWYKPKENQGLMDLKGSLQ
jgi:hypothetical protein